MTELRHIGIARRSGRYPWGSGEDGYQRGDTLRSQVEGLKAKGLTEVERAKTLGMTTTELRSRLTNERASRKAAEAAFALRLKDKGMSYAAISERMGLNEHTVKALLDPVVKRRQQITSNTADFLRGEVDKNDYIFVGAGIESQLSISRTKLDASIRLLRDEGYQIHTIPVKQVGSDKYTLVKVLAKKDATEKEVSMNRTKIAFPGGHTEDGGMSWNGNEEPVKVSMSRIHVRYKEDGGGLKDGVIEIKKGSPDLELGPDCHYAQVRIAVEGGKFMKGMAMHAPDSDFPPGKDIIYNSNKSRNQPDKVFKPFEDDPTDPFGSIIRQKRYVDKNGVEQLSALNMVGSKPGSGEEGAWADWSRSISSQVLSKQKPSLAKAQLAEARAYREDEFNEIMSLTNPAVKKRLLNSLADDCDSAAVHLKAAALPRQQSHVILPFNSIKPNEVYAPNYDNGDRVVLIRHPHGGIFEIPELIVNKRNREAKSIIGDARDAVGIHPSVAQKLSGADFDGDTVVVIRNNERKIKTADSLSGLKNFDPKESYPYYEGMKPLPKQAVGLKMGDITNLITDMSVKGADNSELTRAIRHSMVVIDAYKHKLNYQQSYRDNGIAALKKKYQGSSTSGAATLISRAGSEKHVPHRRQVVKIDPVTGDKIYLPSGKMQRDKSGRLVPKTTKSTQMAEERDAFKLSSGTDIENVYAQHANELKALARKARLEAIRTQDRSYSPVAAKTYATEVKSLRDKFQIANRNKPLEARALIIANAEIRAKKLERPDLDKDDLKKLKSAAMTAARLRVGAKKELIKITDREWEAIQAGAITKSALSKIIENTDLDLLKERSLPRTKRGISPIKYRRLRSMLNKGYSRSEVAAALGLSLKTVTEALEEEKNYE